MALSKRLRTIIDTIPKEKAIADIGTDHGYVPIYLIKHNIVPHAIAMDINKGPLNKALTNIARCNYEDKIQTRLSNGLEKLENGEVKTILISGMGGGLICDILENGKEKLVGIETLILSPHSDIKLVRKKIHEVGFKIVDETFILDDKYYIIIKAIKGQERYISESEYYFGRILTDSKDELYYEYLVNEVIALSELVDLLLMSPSQNVKLRVGDLKEDVEQIKEVLKKWNVEK